MLPILLIMGCTVLLSVVAFHAILNTQREDAFKTLKDNAESFNRSVRICIEDNKNILYAATDGIAQVNLEDEQAIINHLNRLQPLTMFSRVDMFYNDNTVLYQNGERKEAPEGIDFQRIAEQGEYMSPRVIDPISEKETLYYAVPVVRDGKTIAYLMGVIDCASLSKYFPVLAFEGKAFACLIDSTTGDFVLDDWHKAFLNVKEMEDRVPLKRFKEVNLKADILALKTGTTGFTSHTNGETSYMYYTPVGVFDWELLMVIQEPVLFAKVEKVRNILAIVAIIETTILLLYFSFSLYTTHLLAKSREELRKISYQDMMCKIHNRNKYKEDVVKFSQKEYKNIGVAFFDLNGLKKVNDNLGHEEGDRMIKKSAEVMNFFFKDQVYRIGGDEFVVIAPESNSKQFENTVYDIVNTLAKEHILIAFGYSFDENSKSLRAQLRKADCEMYTNKQEFYQKNENN